MMQAVGDEPPHEKEHVTWIPSGGQGLCSFCCDDVCVCARIDKGVILHFVTRMFSGTSSLLGCLLHVDRGGAGSVPGVQMGQEFPPRHTPGQCEFHARCDFFVFSNSRIRSCFKGWKVAGTKP